jgi:tetratricopeptide (TPR) repeat protein
VRLVISWVVLAVLANPALGDSKQRARAKRHLTKATQAYQAGRYEEARKEFTLVYSLDPQPQVLFALGQVNVKLGTCEAATTFLRKYLDTKPDEAQTAAANDALAACKAAPGGDSKVDDAQIEIDPVKDEPAGPPAAQADDDSDLPPGITAPPPRPKSAPAPVAEPSHASASSSAVADRPWYRVTVGVALCGSGAVALVGSGVLYQRARAKLDDAAGTPGYEDAIGLVDDAHRLRTYSLVAAGAGIALAGGGIYYYVRRRAAGEVRVTTLPARRGALVGLAGRF